MKDFALFCFGWAFGSLVMWIYFAKSKLIRSREEWIEAQKKDMNDL